MKSLKTVFLDNITQFCGNTIRLLDKLDDDISQIYEEQYKTKVAINTIISSLIEKGIITETDFKEEMRKVRKKVREE